MMNPNQIAAFKDIEQAQLAIKKGDFKTASQHVAKAAQLAPELEEVWLVMAALVSPQASVACLEKALQINPQSERAQKGMLWARNRLQQEKKAAITRLAASEAPTVVLGPGGIGPLAEKPVEAVQEREAKPGAITQEAERPVEPAQETEEIPGVVILAAAGQVEAVQETEAYIGETAEAGEPAEATQKAVKPVETGPEADEWPAPPWEAGKPVEETQEAEKLAETKPEADEWPAPPWQAGKSVEETQEAGKPAEATQEAEKPVETGQGTDEWPAPTREAEKSVEETQETRKSTETTQQTEKPVEITPETEKPADENQQIEKPIVIVPAILEPKTAPPRRPAHTPKNIQSKKTANHPIYSFLLLLLGVFICVLALAGIVSWFTPTAAFINSSLFTGREHGPAWAQVEIAKPSATPPALDDVVVPTATSLPSSAPELVIPPTTTNTPLPTETPTPTATPLPTATVPTPIVALLATETPLPTNIPPQPTATVELAAVDSASPTPLPTDTAAPAPTQYVAPTPKPIANGGTGTNTDLAGVHWIDVDLTNQMVYAYDGNTLVNSFVVSTGTWQHPTVTGQYHVYLKYRYKDMSGPGYYLPNVPYTMFFYQGYAIHGTYWHSNFGTPMSHGCINLTIPDSEWVYNFSSVGTLINVHY